MKTNVENVMEMETEIRDRFNEDLSDAQSNAFLDLMQLADIYAGSTYEQQCTKCQVRDELEAYEALATAAHALVKKAHP